MKGVPKAKLVTMRKQSFYEQKLYPEKFRKVLVAFWFWSLFNEY